MLFGFGIWLVVLGILGASNLIIARRPDASEYIAKLAPFQGWIGVASAFWGAYGVLSAILGLSWLTSAPILWVTLLATSLLLISLGLLLGVGVMKTFVKSPEAVSRMDAMVTRLAPKQGVLGLAAIGVGTWSIVAQIMFVVS